MQPLSSADLAARKVALDRAFRDGGSTFNLFGEERPFPLDLVPRRLVLTSAHFHRAAHGIDPPNAVRAHVPGIDLIRDERGGFRVLEDNVEGRDLSVRDNKVTMWTTKGEQPVHVVYRRLTSSPA